MGSLKKKKKQQDQQQEPEQKPVEAPDFETLDRSQEVRRRRKRQNNTVLGTPAGNTLGNQG